MINKRSVFAINWAEAESLAAGRHDNPHHILGMHESVDGVYINAFYPGAESVTAVSRNSKDTFNLISDRIPGFYTIKIPEKKSFDYYYIVQYPDGTKEMICRLVSRLLESIDGDLYLTSEYDDDILYRHDELYIKPSWKKYFENK